MPVVQLIVLLIVLVLFVVLLFTMIKGILTFVFIRRPKQTKSQRFASRRLASLDTMESEIEMISLQPGAFVGHEEQLPAAVCLKTGTPVSYCDCQRCRRKSGKVGN